MIAALILIVGIVSLLGAFLSQLTLSEHARHLSWAVNDANRVMEGVRQINTGGGCTRPSATPPGGFPSWDAWLADAGATGGGGKSIQPNPAVNELVVTTVSGNDPLQVTVAVCWRHRQRTLGECAWNGAQLSASDTDGDGVIESPAMLSTAVTCRI